MHHATFERVASVQVIGHCGKVALQSRITSEMWLVAALTVEIIRARLTEIEARIPASSILKFSGGVELDKSKKMRL